MLLKLSSHRCNICFWEELSCDSNNGRLRLCSGCRLIYYCGEKHQKIDYVLHRDMCKIIQNVYETRHIQHMLDINGAITNRESLQKAITSFKCLVMLKLKRKLTPFEDDILTFPKYCEVCLKHNTGELFDCEKCGFVSYCSKGHQNMNSEKHSKICSSLRMHYNYYEVDTFRHEFQFVHPPISGEKYELPGNLVELLGKFSNIGVIPTDPRTNEEYQIFSTASKYSCVSTVLYGLSKLNIYETDNECLTIFIVGAYQEPFNFEEVHCKLLASQLPKIKIITIFFIGPELINSTSNIEYNFERNRQVRISFHVDVVQNFISQKNKTNLTAPVPPNFFVCFNCGFSEYSNLDQDTWSDGIKTMLKYSKTPILFTSYTKNEANLDMRKFETCAKEIGICFDVLLTGEQNPFKDMRPLRNCELNDEDDQIYYRNGYIHLIVPSS